MTDNKGMSSFSLAAIADELDCSVDYLLGRTDSVTGSAESLTPLESRLLDAFRSMPYDEQHELIGRAETLADFFRFCLDRFCGMRSRRDFRFPQGCGIPRQTIFQ